MQRTNSKQVPTGILVFLQTSAPHTLHPICFELLGKACALARQTGQTVSAVLVGDCLNAYLTELEQVPLCQVFLYEDALYRDFQAERYARALQDCIEFSKPSVLLLGGTPEGRSIAPWIAVRLHTGLTADCTALEMDASANLIQIRPAFGGDLFAQIITSAYPQMATVRYQVMKPVVKTAVKTPLQTVARRVLLPPDNRLQILKRRRREQQESISQADRLVVVGRGVRCKEDLALFRTFADCLQAPLACSRALVERGWISSEFQIGLSGKSVRPKAAVLLGVSGSVQFQVGIRHCAYICAVNTDPQAPIFTIADHGILADIYELIPQFIERFYAAGAKPSL